MILNLNNPIIRGRGFEKYEALLSEGKVERGDMLVFPQYETSVPGKPQKYTMQAAVIDDVFLSVRGNPYDLSIRTGGGIGYKAALEGKPWALIKKEDIPKIQRMSLKEREGLYGQDSPAEVQART
jgi:hypothetical protein